MSFQLVAPYKPAGDQPKAIQELVKGIQLGGPRHVLLGVTGSGKTFTIANAVEALNRPTLVISHNKTLAAQLYSEFRSFFPNNAVEYFVSYYDYYQPEVYLPATGVYIEKELAINDELERMRLSTVSSLLSGRRDVLVVASVSCIYGAGRPEAFKKNAHLFQVGDQLTRNDLLRICVDMLYSRNDTEFQRGHFRVKGDTIDVFVAYADYAYRFVFWGDELESIHKINPNTGTKLETIQEVLIFPASLFIMNKDALHRVMQHIRCDLSTQIHFFENLGKFEEAKRLKERTELDLEMLQELGYCPGIENYSRYIDGRSEEERPFCLLDYFPKDYLMVIDESHVTIPQFRAMWGGDRVRKTNLVAYGFRLPAAMDNRPLSFDEFESLIHQVVYVSATPTDYELQAAEGVVVEQIIRPTGLLDPQIEVRPSVNQIHDMLKAIKQVVHKDERVFITTLTKRMAEELTTYLLEANVRCRYMHSEVKTLDRVVLLNELRNGTFDVLVGVNLLREGLDVPQVSLMLILDADKEGFLRNVRSLIQTIGRVARHAAGRVIMYADRITGSMQQAMDETARRRSLQMKYNLTHRITPNSVGKNQIVMDLQKKPSERTQSTGYATEYGTDQTAFAADVTASYGLQETPIQERIQLLEKQMYAAAAALRFLEADRIKETIETLRNCAK